MTARISGRTIPTLAPMPMRILPASLPPASLASIPLSASPSIPLSASIPLPPDSIPTSLFPHIRALSLDAARALALQRSSALALSGFKVAAARAAERDVSRRLKINTAGGLDPFSGQIRFYLALDLERLAGLNRAEKDGARQKFQQEQIGQRSAGEDAIKRVTAAYYALFSSQVGVQSAEQRRQVARALYVASDARFRSGAGELSSALSTLGATSEAEAAYQGARQKVVLDCLELAQSCGYLTAEEMEAAL